MEEQILAWPKQLKWEPKIENAGKLAPAGKVIVCGMGGSALPGLLLAQAVPTLNLFTHRDYDLPAWPEAWFAGALVICVSHSGNTAETLSSFDEARRRGLPLAVVTTGGALLDSARSAGVPYIVVPSSESQAPSQKMQPRLAAGYMIRALLALLGEREQLQTLAALADELRPAEWRVTGEDIARRLSGKIPLIYTSTPNAILGYVWKIKFNETAKYPAFANVVSEANHNELEVARARLADFYQLWFRDAADDPRVAKRLAVLADLAHAQGLAGESLEGRGETTWAKIFYTLLLADWVTLKLARDQNIDPEAVPTIEEFKKRLN